MKKIGIITFHNAINYGAVLQMYALKEYLSNNYNISIIDYENSGITSEYKMFSKEKKLKQNIKDFIKNLIFLKKISKKKKKFEEFNKREFKYTKKYKTYEELKNNPPKLDIMITGSDQVWNPMITNGLDNSYFLDFGDDNCKKIAYAASCGSINIFKQNKDEFIKRLDKIDYISIREKEVADEARKYVNKEVYNSLDPTLLLSKEEWEKNLPKNNKKSKYIFLYSVGNKKDSQRDLCNKIATKIAVKENLEILNYNLKKPKNTIDSYTDGPLEFLSAIKNAEYVVASSFHAAVFSIIFNKKMWIAANKKTSTRVENLMSMMGLSERIVYDNNIPENLEKNIDFQEVNKILEREKEKSINWLIDAIEK